MKQVYIKKSDRFAAIGSYFQIEDLLKSPEKILKQAGLEPWATNIFYTVNKMNLGSRKGQDFIEADIIAFDIDNVDLSKHAQYKQVLLNVLGITTTKIGVICSGNGLHFIIKLNKIYSQNNFCQIHKKSYDSFCDKISEALKINNLPFGKVDKIFDAARLLRVPMTMNEKPGRPHTRCEVLESELEPVDLFLKSGLTPQDSIDKNYAKKNPIKDNTAILDGCSFLKECAKSPEKISEPQWYAMLSITARMKDGNELSHKLSMGHGSYSKENTDKKIKQALTTSGPRTCENIGTLSSACEACPYQGIITSPIQIKKVSEIPSEANGFYISTTKGRKDPQYNDLINAFTRDFGDFICNENGVYIFNGTHFISKTHDQILSYAEKMFQPDSSSFFREEFFKKLKARNYFLITELSETIINKVNFKNGVLSLDPETGESTFTEGHSPDLFFTYCIDYNYDPCAVAPLFQKSLSQWLPGKEEEQNTLLEFMGYCLSGCESAIGNKALILVGEGSNGKSIFLDTLMSLVSVDAYSPVPIDELHKDTVRNMLNGKLFNNCSEISNKQIRSAELKKLISGEGTLARPLYGHPYMLKNRAKFIAACNDLPKIDDNSKGTYRRLLIVKFNQTFSSMNGNVNKNLKNELIQERPGILNIAIKGYQRFLSQKKFSSNTSEAIAELKSDNDPVTIFAKEELDFHEQYEFISQQTIYGAYKDWAELSNFKPVNARVFFKNLRREYPVIDTLNKIKKENNLVSRGFVGIKLNKIPAY